MFCEMQPLPHYPQNQNLMRIVILTALSPINNFWHLACIALYDIAVDLQWTAYSVSCFAHVSQWR